MSSDLIRPFRDEDLPAVARIWRDLRPDAMHSEDGLRHLVGSFPERAQPAFWVAEDDGVVAWCFAHRRWHRATDNGYVWLGVLRSARGRGVGAALWELAEEHLDAIGVARINADVVGDEAGARFLERRGFAPVRTVVISAVDPRRVDGDELAERRAAAEQAGYGLVPYAEVEVHALFALELSLSADEPGEDEPRQLTFEECRDDLFEGPDLTREGSFAVVSAGEPVAYAALSVGRARGAAATRGRRPSQCTAAAGSPRSRSSPSSGGRRQTGSTGSSPTTTSGTRRCSRSTAASATSRSPSAAGT